MENESVKNFLKKIREEKNLTQDQLAEASGVARYIISEFENQKRRPSPRTISRLAEALGCSYIELIAGKQDSEEEKRKNRGENKQQYLAEAVSLTKMHYSNKGFDEELLMQISGYLSYLIEEYDTSCAREKNEIIKEIKEQRAKLLAGDLFLKTKAG
jgi:transcriptional regulator with XRE-family HTH domain